MSEHNSEAADGDNVVRLPPPPEREPLLAGPFQVWKVIVDGRAIPGLTGFPDGEGQTALVVDDRFCITFPTEHAYGAAWLIAQAIAIGQGYPFSGALTKDQPFAPTISSVGPLP